MRLKNLLGGWLKGEDRRAIERAKLDSQLTQAERDADREDFEGRKDDVAASSSWAGSGAVAAADEVDEP